MIKLPKHFKFAGMDFTVSILDKVVDDEDGTSELYGDFNTNTNEIRIAKTIYGSKVTEQSMLNTYYHELAHALQYYYNNEQDESFAQSIGNLLMEYNQTKN